MEIQNNMINHVQVNVVNPTSPTLEQQELDSTAVKNEDKVVLGFNAEEMKEAHTLNEERVARLLGLI